MKVRQIKHRFPRWYDNRWVRVTEYANTWQSMFAAWAQPLSAVHAVNQKLRGGAEPKNYRLDGYLEAPTSDDPLGLGLNRVHYTS